jgi:hypothetical protein
LNYLLIGHSEHHSSANETEEWQTQMRWIC